MNVLFLDVDGVLNCKKTFNTSSNTNIDEEKVKILSDICIENDLKVVISSSWKLSIEYDYIGNSLYNLLEILEDNSIEVVGFTPNIPNPYRCYGQEMWKDYDIECYLYEHPEVLTFCIIDDDMEGDLENMKDYLVKTYYSIDDSGNGGILKSHDNDIKKALSLSKNFKR